jgi:hypothetical protein
MGLLDAELATLVTRRDDVARFVAEGERVRQQLGTLDALAQRAAGRLDTMSLEERKGVIALLDVRVEVLDKSRRPALRVRGTVADIGLSRNADDGQRWRHAHAVGAAPRRPRHRGYRVGSVS